MSEDKKRGISVGMLLLIVVVIIALVIAGITIANKTSKSKTVENGINDIAEITTTNREAVKYSENATFKHKAVMGCKVTYEDEKTGEVTYKQICEICGEMESGAHKKIIKEPLYSSAFYCQTCKQTQTVEISTEISE